MSKIDELIQELCPGGVPTKPLEEVGRFFSGLSGKSKADFESGNAPFVTYLDVGNNASLPMELSGRVRIQETERQNSISMGDLLFTGSSEDREGVGLTSEVEYEPSVPTYLNSFCFGFRPDSGLFVTGFLKHLMRSPKVRIQVIAASNGVTRINVSKRQLALVAIVIPPLEVQKEIVSILDKFTQLEAELEAELEARRTQYEVTRDRLLDFSSDLESHPLSKMIMELCHEGVTFGELSNVTLMDAGDRVTKANMSNLGQYDVYGAGTVPTGKLDDWNREDSLIFSRAGAGAGFVNFIPARFWATDVCFVAEQKPAGPLIKFVYYWMKSQQHELMRHTYGGSMPKIDKRYLWTHPVPLPHFEVQKEIVAILDKLDALVNDIKIGLPAEIAARRKQYEYYRDKLLTFKEFDAA